MSPVTTRRKMDPRLSGRGFSALRCDTCGHHLTKKEERLLIQEYILSDDTSSCGHDIYADDVIVSVLPEYQHLMNLRTARNTDTVWYHTSANENWPTPIQGLGWGRVTDGEFVAHVGTLQAALDRCSYSERTFQPTFLYHLKLSAKARWSPKILLDENYWPTSVPELKRAPEFFGDVTRYVNRYEDPGSISLLVRTGIIEVVKTEVIDWDRLTSMRGDDTVQV